MYKLNDSLVAFGRLPLLTGVTALATPCPARGQGRHFLLPGLLSLAALVLLPGGSHAQSVLTDDAQTSTAPKATASNFGTNPSLSVNGARNVYLKFKLSSTLPANTPGASVERATLKLYLANITAAGKLDVYPIAGAWDEATITGSDAPPLGSLLTTTAQIGLDKRGKFLVIDVTPLVRQWLGDDGLGAGGAPNNGLAVVAHPSDATTPEVASITFDSKENSQTSHEPQLHIQLRGAAGGLQQVERDAPLTGDGTAAAPLGVAAGGVNTTHLADGSVTGAKIADGSVASSELADGAVTSAKITAPLSLVSAGPGATLSVANTGAGAALTATGAVNTTTQYNIDGVRVLSTPGVANTFVGEAAGRANTTGKNNAFFGTLAGPSNTTGISNSFFGVGAGYENTTGSTNSFFGASAGQYNTSGANNAFFGFSAGYLNVTGGGNSFFGYLAGQSNTTGGENSFFGSRAGVLNSTGARNAFFGLGAGQLNISGSDNAFFGWNAGRGNSGAANAFFGSGGGVANTTGSVNSFFGASAGEANTTGSSNSFFGARAGASNTTSNSNSFFGSRAGFINTTGFANSFFGAQSGESNTTGFYNSFFGVFAGQSNEAGQDNSFFGHLAGAANTSGRDNSFFGEAAGRFNTTGDSNSFFGRTAGANTTGGGNSFFGGSAGFSNTTGSNNVFLGLDAGRDNTTGSSNTYVGFDANGAGGITNATAVGANASVTQSNSLILGSGVHVGIGTTAPKARLHVVGGKVYVEANGQGVVLKSPGGACFELTVTDAGVLVTAPSACP